MISQITHYLSAVTQPWLGQLLCLLALFFAQLSATNVQADNLTLPFVNAAAIDGSATNARFSLTVESASATNKLSTQQLLDISVSFKPDTANLESQGSAYAVLVKNNTFYLLRPDRTFTPWNGSIETLLPFRSDVTLSETSRVHLMSGRLIDPGEYQIFTAYSAQEQRVIKFTPEPFVLMVNQADQSPEMAQASQLYQAQVESRIVQLRCIVCHVEGGAARNSALKFQRNMTGAALNNLNTLLSYLSRPGNSVDTLLGKASGGNGHPGGQQIVRGGQDYNAMEQVLRLLDADRLQQNQGLVYRFESGQTPAPVNGSASLLASVELAPREAIFRRASILIAGQAPTAAQLAAVRNGDDNALRTALRGLMSGPRFKDFVVNAANDRLLTRGAEGAINHNTPNFPLIRMAAYNSVVAGTHEDFKRNIESRLLESARRASEELVAHVVMNELPYSEILTANYMMMNPLLNQYLGGTATFSPEAGDKDFLPSRITQYYTLDRLEISQDRKFFNGNDAGQGILSMQAPVADYPHAGLLTDMGFLSRYPTTATNRNRARARWTLYHFLGIDIEKSSARPLDEATLADRNNPTMNNPNCTVCHAVLDPVAGAFQNWSEYNTWKHNGTHSLDAHYTNPVDGTVSPYRQGDLWYRDMRLPGLFETTLTSRDYTLRELANTIVREPAFLTAAARFWWPAVFGDKLVNLPSVETDQGFADKSAAFNAQQASIAGFARVLGERGNAKDMLVEMMMSPWFTAGSAKSHEFRAVQMQANLGAPRLLGPEQLTAKTLNLTGVDWGGGAAPSGLRWNGYERLNLILGGIDSITVLERATVLTPTIFAAQRAYMAEVSCPAVVKDFGMPLPMRRLFTGVEPWTVPMELAAATFDVTSAARAQWQEIKVEASIPAEGASIHVNFDNPYCDYDGVKCLEQRMLHLQGISLRHASGAEMRFTMNSPEISVSGQNCYVQGQEATFYGQCKMTLALQLDAAYDIDIVAHVSAQQAPSKPEPVRASIEVVSQGDILTVSTPNSRLIKQQIVELVHDFHGRTLAPDSPELQQIYALFAVAMETARMSGKEQINPCSWMEDGNFLTDLLTPAQLLMARQPSPDGGSWINNWEYQQNSVARPLLMDTNGSKRGWIAVLAYLMTHHDYMHE